MKKFLLVSFLCITPLFVSHAADLTVEDCANYITYSNSSTQADFNKLNPLIQDVLRIEENLNQWISNEEFFATTDINEDADIFINFYLTCLTINAKDEDTQKQELKKLTLTLQKALFDYKTIETRKRIPFVRHGNVLPGPAADEDGSFYVEQKFIPKFVNGSLIFLMSLSILMVIVGGLMFLFSSGDSELTSRAKTTILWAIVGVVLTILAYAIVQFIIGIDFSLQ